MHDYLEFVGLEHLPAKRGTPRWGHGRPPHAALEAIISRYADSYSAVIDEAVGLIPDLSCFPLDDVNDFDPCWRNNWLPALDTVAIYTMLRSRSPRRYLEVGSGFSTRVAARAVRDGGLDTELVSIDPVPRASIDALCDDVIRQPVEAVPPTTWTALEPGDVLFVDNSHRALMHSDVTTFFLEVLPALADGVIVGVHDILLPSDYFAEWGDYLFSEQYLLATYLLAGSPWVTPLFAAYWSSEYAGLDAPLGPLWASIAEPSLNTGGWSFWFTVRRHGNVDTDQPTDADA